MKDKMTSCYDTQFKKDIKDHLHTYQDALRKFENHTSHFRDTKTTEEMKDILAFIIKNLTYLQIFSTISSSAAFLECIIFCFYKLQTDRSLQIEL